MFGASSAGAGTPGSVGADLPGPPCAPGPISDPIGGLTRPLGGDVRFQSIGICSDSGWPPELAELAELAAPEPEEKDAASCVGCSFSPH